ncbi:hypothetical protein HK104_006983 [Borealophlyctis nickersoniae]|nr:hypothetical protein HK104_006983 [Borealophlyctis nickersoniae]
MLVLSRPAAVSAGFGYGTTAGSPLFERAVTLGPKLPETSQIPLYRPVRQTRWTADEDALLCVGREKGVPMKKIAASLPGRSVHSCHNRWRMPQDDLRARKRGMWSHDEVSKLQSILVEMRTSGQKVDLGRIARALGRTSRSVEYKCEQLRVTKHGPFSPKEDAIIVEGLKNDLSPNTLANQLGRWRRSVMWRCFALDGNRQRGKWSLEEDAKLKEGVAMFGRTWGKVSDHVGTRGYDDCRVRCISVNTLRKGRWSQAEDEKLMALYGKVGANAGEIARNFGGNRNYHQVRWRLRALGLTGKAVRSA